MTSTADETMTGAAGLAVPAAVPVTAPPRVVARLTAELRPERLRLAVVGLLAVLSVGFLVAGPEVLGRATNIVFNGLVSQRFPAGLTKAQAIAGLRAEGHGQLADMFSAMNIAPGAGVDFTRLGAVLGLAALVYALSAIFNWAQGYLMTGVAQRACGRLRQAAEEKLGRLPISYFDSHPHGDILSRVTNDIDNIATALQDALSQLVVAVLTVTGVLGLMFWLSPVLAAVSLVTIPLVMAVTLVIAGKAKTRFTAQWNHVGGLNALVEETLTGHELVLAYGRRQQVTEEFGRQNTRLREAGFRAQFLSGVILPGVLLISNLNFAVISALGGYLVATGALSLGAVQAFLQYSGRFAMPITQIASQVNLFQSAAASAERVFSFLDNTDDALALDEATAPVDAPVEEVVGKVQLRHVCFRYAPDIPLIDDFTLDVQPGQTVAIVGSTGAGKTTIVNLLMRFYEIDSGQILLDGVDYRDLRRDQVRRCFGMVLQDTWLFSGTIRDNIGYGREGASDAQILAAAAAAHVDDFVRTLPDGYDTVLDGDASGISSGQRQLLTIARAFLADPGILILDEATSNVDTRTEVLIQDATTRLRSRRTSFVIAHRLSTVRDADMIVVMDAGRVVEQGRHDDLVGRGGIYHKLYTSQFADGSDADRRHATRRAGEPGHGA